MPFKIPVVNLAIPDDRIDLQKDVLSCKLVLVVDQLEMDTTETKTLLDNIVKYMNLPSEKQAIIGIKPKKSINLYNLLNNTTADKIVIFGIPLDRLHANLEVKPYQPKQWLGKAIFFAHNLRQLATNVKYKKDLFNMINTSIKQ